MKTQIQLVYVEKLKMLVINPMSSLNPQLQKKNQQLKKQQLCHEKMRPVSD
jgi:ABC-type microcin C transport system duplicated ATPase subunit YejF